MSEAQWKCLIFFVHEHSDTILIKLVRVQQGTINKNIVFICLERSSTISVNTDRWVQWKEMIQQDLVDAKDNK